MGWVSSLETLDAGWALATLAGLLRNAVVLQLVVWTFV
jgi:hypothetical protein